VEPIRIRTTLYARLSKPAYLRIQIACFALLLAGFIWLSIRPPDMSRAREALALAKMGAVTTTPEPYDFTIPILTAYVFAVEHGRWFLAGAMLLGAAETLWMLRRYRVAERHAQNQVPSPGGAAGALVQDERSTP
jgi:hypothetical protein